MSAFRSPAVGEMVAELERIRSVVTRLATEPLRNQAAAEMPADLSEDEQALVALLSSARTAMLQSPSGANALVRFLVTEGQSFAATSEGARWHAALVGAPEVERLREIWEAVSLNVLDDLDDDATIPTAWLDVLNDLVTANGVDRLIESLRPDGLS